MSDQDSKSVQCPKCRSFDVRRSYPRPIIDGILSRGGKTPLRCRRCGHRYYHKLLPGEVLGLHELDDPLPYIPEHPESDN